MGCAPIHQGKSSNAALGDVKKIALCCASRKRRQMLAGLLESILHLHCPSELELIVIIVENDSEPFCRDFVTGSIGEKIPFPVFYFLEKNIGIASARNRAVNEALIRGADFIAFVDDDEIVPPNWLQDIFQVHLSTGAKLVGGPIRPIIDNSKHGYLKSVIAYGVARRYRKVETKAKRRAELGRIEKITIVTNNWLATHDLFTTHGLSFDESLNLSGGEDTEFFRAVRKLGLTTAWASDAIIHERVPDSRLSLKYQFDRSVAQSRTSTISKLNEAYNSPNSFSVLILTIFVRIITTFALILSVPLTAGYSVVQTTRAIGWIYGRLLGFMGRKSQFYREITGS